MPTTKVAKLPTPAQGPHGISLAEAEKLAAISRAYERALLIMLPPLAKDDKGARRG